MDRDEIDKLIIYLIAIENFAKDIHYNCKGQSFYGKHLFADRIAKNMNGYIDLLKEVCLLGHNHRVLNSGIYLDKASQIIPQEANFENMHWLLVICLNHIETIDNIPKGDENLIGAIAQDIQNNVGLINIMFGDYSNDLY